MIRNYKTEGRNPKDFRNYQSPIELFGNLRDGNVNPREILKSQINFKSVISPDFTLCRQIWFNKLKLSV